MVLMSAPDVGLPLGAPHCHSSFAADPKSVLSQLTVAVVRDLASILLDPVVNSAASATSCPRSRCCGSSVVVPTMKMLIQAELIVAATGTPTVVHRKPACSCVWSTVMLVAIIDTTSAVVWLASSALAPTTSSIVVSISMG